MYEMKLLKRLFGPKKQEIIVRKITEYKVHFTQYYKGDRLGIK